MPYCIYVITNLINGKKYVGQTTKSLEDRFKDHCSKRKTKMYIQKAILKYGKNNFRIELLEEVSTIEELNRREQFYISHLNTLEPNGYNLTTGGVKFRTSEATKEKLRKANKGKIPYRMTDEVRNKISISLKGRKPKWTGQPRSEEHRIKLSASLKGRKTWNKGMGKYDYVGSPKNKAVKAAWQRKWRAENKEKMRNIWKEWENKNNYKKAS